MSRYLVDQLATRPKIRTVFAAELAAVHGDLSIEAIEVRDASTGETTRLDSGGLYIFIGADAETARLPPEVALDDRGFVLDKRPGRVRVRRRALRAGKARGRRRRRGQHGNRLRASVPQERRRS